MVAKGPVRLSDDERRWEHECKALKTERRRRLWDQLERETGAAQVDWRRTKWADVVAGAYQLPEQMGPTSQL